MSNKTYDTVKDIAMLWLPIGTTLYGTVAATWGFPYTDAILTTLVAIDTALGAVVKYYANKYNKAISDGTTTQ